MLFRIYRCQIDGHNAGGMRKPDRRGHDVENVGVVDDPRTGIPRALVRFEQAQAAADAVEPDQLVGVAAGGIGDVAFRIGIFIAVDRKTW